MKDVAYIALGSNLGKREVFLAQARRAIADLATTRVLGLTDAEETAPIGPVVQGPFLNQMIAIETELSPQDLLAELKRIETDAGRIRRARWGPRTLDLDIVLFENQSVREPGLTVPHPELSNRDFWLRELATLRGSRVG
ncbi:MAG TPA: 2-amino-4-hydroxy-6-hydroxymethyldihydropteridine diphosphokinase [Gemmatimonadaceae bacterium]|nr:2-amino-4-hydroxy-6-hydroxymethyldihydropteridine diphosphokinase [Gemmatimonadaceae bacterium]